MGGARWSVGLQERSPQHRKEWSSNNKAQSDTSMHDKQCACSHQKGASRGACYCLSAESSGAVYPPPFPDPNQAPTKTHCLSSGPVRKNNKPSGIGVIGTTYCDPTVENAHADIGLPPVLRYDADDDDDDNDGCWCSLII